MWSASVDLRKECHRIEENALFDATKVQEVLQAWYHDQVELVQGRQFPIKRRVKQRDVLSPLLFNAGMEYAMQKLHFPVQHCGLHGGNDWLSC